MFYRDKSCAASHHHSRLGEVHRHNGNLFQMNIVPHVELGPVGKGKYPDALALVDSTIVDIPKLGPLILGVPLAERIPKGVNAFLGARLFLIPAGSAEGCVKSAGRQRIEERPGLQQTAALLRSEAEGIGSLVDCLRIGVDDQPRTDLRAKPVPELDHFPELIGCIDVQQGKRNRSGMKRLLGQPDHHRGVLADGVQHHRTLEFGGDFPYDVNTFGFQLTEMRKGHFF
jgi:hypothetical protein